MHITSESRLVQKIRIRQAREKLSRYELSQQVASILMVTPQSVDKKLARIFEGSPIDVAFVIAVGKVLGLRLDIGDMKK